MHQCQVGDLLLNQGHPVRLLAKAWKRGQPAWRVDFLAMDQAPQPYVVLERCLVALHRRDEVAEPRTHKSGHTEAMAQARAALVGEWGSAGQRMVGGQLLRQNGVTRHLEGDVGAEEQGREVEAGHAVEPVVQSERRRRRLNQDEEGDEAPAARRVRLDPAVEGGKEGGQEGVVEKEEEPRGPIGRIWSVVSSWFKK